MSSLPPRALKMTSYIKYTHCSTPENPSKGRSKSLSILRLLADYKTSPTILAASR